MHFQSICCSTEDRTPPKTFTHPWSRAARSRPLFISTPGLNDWVPAIFDAAGTYETASLKPRAHVASVIGHHFGDKGQTVLLLDFDHPTKDTAALEDGGHTRIGQFDVHIFKIALLLRQLKADDCPISIYRHQREPTKTTFLDLLTHRLNMGGRAELRWNPRRNFAKDRKDGLAV
jgi:hypothetical protein